MPTRPEEIPTAADYSLPESDLTGSRSTLRHHQPAAFTSVGRRGVMQVGNNLVTLNVSKQKQVTLRELGGQMAPLWNHSVDSIEYRQFISWVKVYDAGERRRFGV